MFFVEGGTFEEDGLVVEEEMGAIDAEIADAEGGLKLVDGVVARGQDGGELVEGGRVG